MQKTAIIGATPTPSVKELYDNSPYNFDTMLSNGYHLSCRYIDEGGYIKKVLTLNTYHKIIDTLNIMGYAALDQNLGYIGADFTDYFALVFSYGSGNPSEMEWRRKKDGKILRTGYFLNSFSNPELLLYSKHYDTLLIYDIEKRKDIQLKNIQYNCPLWQLGDLLTIESADKHRIVVKYQEMDKNIQRWMFKR